MSTTTFDFDYVVIGSGFGGSVSALRLAEKGYSVAVVERGKRWRSEDFPRTNWNLRKYLWAPKIFCFGIQAFTFLRDTMVLHGCGVGGGSLVYAKNTLDKNYLYFAERRGVRIIAETEVRAIRELAGGGYELDTVAMRGLFFKRRGTLRCRGIVAAAGVLGTVPLLMKCKLRGSLPRISSELGRFVRTNSEALVGSTSRERGVDYSKGVAIASGFRPDDQTEIEMCRYGDGQDLLSLLCTLLVPGGPPWPRWLRFLGEVIRRPRSKPHDGVTRRRRTGRTPLALFSPRPRLPHLRLPLRAARAVLWFSPATVAQTAGRFAFRLPGLAAGPV